MRGTFTYNRAMTFHPRPLNTGRKRLLLGVVLLLAILAGWLSTRDSADRQADEPVRPAMATQKNAGTKPALTVAAVIPQSVEWPQVLTASGNIAAWQEAVISAEISNLRLTEVLVNVGDQVKSGQVLARMSSDTVKAELAESDAAVAEAEAMLADARANGERARELQRTGFISAQSLSQSITTEKTGIARLNAARARLHADRLRLAQTAVRAPDAGVISARAATVGSLTQPGQELFRLIRGGRLEWRAEVGAADLGRLKPGIAARLTAPDGQRVLGRVRMAAPTVDPQTLNGLVYVDLPAAATRHSLRAGTFARGEFELGRTRSLSLPQSAVLLRDGFAYVFRIDDGARVRQIKVTTGRRLGRQIEIVGGIAPDTRLVAAGAGFLADGDTVRVVEAPVAAAGTLAASQLGSGSTP